MIHGKAWKFGDDVDTDVIIPGKYLNNPKSEEIAKHAMEGLDPLFSQKVARGDVIVAGNNFGCGSSREQAVGVLKEIGIAAIVARSFARIFYRNAVNLGLPVLECTETEGIETGDELAIDVTDGVIHNLSTKTELHCTVIPDFMQEIIEAGGLVPLKRKQKGLA